MPLGFLARRAADVFLFASSDPLGQFAGGFRVSTFLSEIMFLSLAGSKFLPEVEEFRYLKSEDQTE